MIQRDEMERLRALDARITEVKGKLAPPPAKQDHHSMAQIGWRMVIELVSGLGIGAAMGYGLDVLFGTLPIFLVLLTLLGFAAGVQTMMRSARELAEKHTGATPPEREDAEHGR